MSTRCSPALARPASSRHPPTYTPAASRPVRAALFPELVRAHADLTGYVADEDGWRERMFSEGIDAVTPIGVLGDPSKASAEAGESIFAHLTAYLASWIDAELSSSIGAHSKS